VSVPGSVDDADWVIDHTGLGVSDIHVAERFYTAILAPLGLTAVVHLSRSFEPSQAGDKALGAVAFGASYPSFWIDVFHPPGARQHTAFRAHDRQSVNAFHAAGLKSGGVDNGQPDYRTGSYPPGYYAAFVFDPDGNNIEAVFRDPHPPKA
jgi:catechol 2,3-dioxygenase-like lactoylglutathione lyase family enzyme